MTTPLKTFAAALALGLAASEAAAQVNIQIRLPGPAIRTPVPTQPVRLPFPQIPVKPLPSQLAVQPVVLPKVELPPVVIPAQPRVIAPGQTGPAPVAVLIESVMKDEKTPKDAALSKVFDAVQAGPKSDPVDLRDEEDLPEEPRTQPARRVTLPEWDLEQDLGIR